MPFKLARIAPISAVILLLGVTSALFLMERDTDKSITKTSPISMDTGSPKPVAPVNMQNEVLSSTNPTTEQNKTNAPVLSNLVAGLESKVAADPANLGNQILLAQTYGEIGRLEEGVQLMHKLQSQHPSDQRIPVILAMLLTKNDDPNNLNQALDLLSKIDKNTSDQWSAAMFQKGMIYMKMNKKDEAHKEWKMALSGISESDPYRSRISKALSEQNGTVNP